MVLAVPKEVMAGEKRVAMVPDTASKLIKKGFEIHIEKDAGYQAGFTNEQYEKAGVILF